MKYRRYILMVSPLGVLIQLGLDIVAIVETVAQAKAWVDSH